MIVSLILILLMNSVVFILLNLSFGFKKNKVQVVILMGVFLFISCVTGKLLESRYTILINFASDVTNKSIEEVKHLNEDSVRHFTLSQWRVIKDDGAKNILSQLENDCNKNDSISCYLYLSKVDFNNLLIWTHKTGNGNKIFLVSCPEK